ncbi:type IV fimbrial biogenesis protein FimT [Pseudomonas sp. SORGH_AS199]|uniref:GspH/FimT family pseudopilin n=1 Tax=Pseudomonas TaxID=286 RepID=UPI002094BFF7|nr:MULTISPECIES: GspH/FimT family pseudopilin [Pseudomonas]MDR6231906.1 type IV fimbrial biogenesis protein FimT [Pseudomonas sp. SORGH_AS_0199]
MIPHAWPYSLAKKTMRTQYGFTLIETMVAIAILAIVISIAAPSFTRILQSNRAAVLSNELLGTLQLARSEALKRRTNVVLCRSTAGSNVCVDGADWSSGWRLMQGTIVLRTWEPISGGTLTGPSTGITYQSNGLSGAQATFTITTAPTCSRTIQISATGNATVNAGGCP